MFATLPEDDFEILNPCTDYGFKRAFHDQEVLSDFLNSLWSLQEGSKITEIEYLDAGMQSADPIGRHFTVDIRCKTQSGEHYLIEMQNDYFSDYTDKAHVEHCRMFGHIDAASVSDVSDRVRIRMPSGSTYSAAKEFWQDITAVRMIVITNREQVSGPSKKHFSDESLAEPLVINTYSLRHEDDDYRDRHLGDINSTVTLVMLDLFKKTEDQLEDDQDRWLFALKDDRLKSGKSKIPKFKHVHSRRKTTGSRRPLVRFYTSLNKNSIGQEALTEYVETITKVNSILSKKVF